MNRRNFMALLGGTAAAWPLAASAQPASRVYRVGVLSPGAPFAENTPLGSAIARGFRQRGYTVGQNLVIERRGAMGRNDRVPPLVQELVAAKVDLILVAGYPTAVAAKNSGLPVIVTHGTGDPVATGLVESWARPGGNITGISENATELSTKRLQLLKECAPAIRKVAMLWNKDDLGMTLRYDASAKVADALGVAVQAVGVREPNDFDDAFAAMTREKPDAILMVSDSLTVLNRKRVFEFAASARIPAIYESDFFAREGGLMSYGPDLLECMDRATALADRVLKGAKPADLPFEQPTKFPFLINLKTAKALGLEVPPMLLARADEVIE